MVGHPAWDTPPTHPAHLPARHHPVPPPSSPWQVWVCRSGQQHADAAACRTDACWPTWRRHRGIDRKNYQLVEHLLRKGRKQLGVVQQADVKGLQLTLGQQRPAQ